MLAITLDRSALEGVVPPHSSFRFLLERIMDLTKLKSIASKKASVIFVCMNAILQKKFIGIPSGTVFYLKKHDVVDDLEIFQTDTERNNKGERFWLTKEFVLGEFEIGYKPKCWTKDLFLVF